MRAVTLKLAIGLALAGLVAAVHAHGGPLHETLMRLHGH